MSRTVRAEIGTFFRALTGYGSVAFLARVPPALSILALWHYATFAGLPDTVEFVVKAYDDALTDFFDFLQLDRLVDLLILILNRYFDFSITVVDSWRQIAALMGFYFYREAIVVMFSGTVVSGLYNFVAGSVAIFIGVYAIGFASGFESESIVEISLFIMPILSAQIYHITGLIWDATFLRAEYAARSGQPQKGWWEHFWFGLPRGASRTVFGIVFGFISYFVCVWFEVKNPGLLSLVFIVMLFGFYWLWDAISHSARSADQSGTRFEVYMRSSHTKLGIAILGSFTLALFAPLIEYAINTSYQFVCAQFGLCV